MSTPAIRTLERAKINFTIHTYDDNSLDHALSYGEAVAAQLGVSPERLFKTLVIDVDGAPHIAAVPVAGSLDLKAFAKAAGGKRAVMASAAVAERSTGYVTGGISPFGQRKRLPFVVDVSKARSPDRTGAAGAREGSGCTRRQNLDDNREKVKPRARSAPWAGRLCKTHEG